MIAPRPSFIEFEDWARTNLGFDRRDGALKNWLDTNIRNAQLTLQRHPLLQLIQNFLVRNRSTGRRKEINIITRDLEIGVKSFESVYSKLYRVNVLNNDSFPDPPRRGWIDERNLFERINDLVRSTIICQHINEPVSIAATLAVIGTETSIKSRQSAQARDDGYYAYHFYYEIPVDIMDRSWNARVANVDFEIQITTQMQNMLYELTHIFYDRERNEPLKDRNSWKWDYKSSRFSASYLSHALHLLEGMIARLYDEVEKEVPSSIVGPKGDNGSDVSDPRSV